MTGMLLALTLFANVPEVNWLGDDKCQICKVSKSGRVKVCRFYKKCPIRKKKEK